MKYLAIFPTFYGYGPDELIQRAIQIGKKSDSDGKPQYCIENVGVEHDHEEIPID